MPDSEGLVRFVKLENLNKHCSDRFKNSTLWKYQKMNWILMKTKATDKKTKMKIQNRSISQHTDIYKRSLKIRVVMEQMLNKRLTQGGRMKRTVFILL